MKIKWLIMMGIMVLMSGCNRVSMKAEPVEITDTVIETANETNEVVLTSDTEMMDSSLKEETCSISVKAIETVDHHGNELLIMRSEDEDYLDAEKGFAIFDLDDMFKGSITDVSWKEGCPVSLDDLRYVQVLYKGFDDSVHIGGIVVHYKVAEEILEIFKELYDVAYMIERIRPIYHYTADDDLSMEANNTSAFNYRVVEGSTNLSKHSYGIAIDINPVQNPYVRGDHVSPEAGNAYLDRSLPKQGMILAGDPCYEAFVSRDWTWGGHWNTMKDYQHFQKNIDLDELTTP